MAPAIDLMDDTFVVAERAELATYVRDPAVARAWWPRLTLTVHQDRGLEGVRWTVAGELTGSTEIWLERWGDGVLVHWFLRADPARTPSPRGVRRLARRYTVAYKERIHELKDRLEHGRPAGVPRLPPAR
ncbi:polyketide cyclase / dehydrase and lipid transport [Jiangella ureilytica]|uniref:Polyketide cyclase / dehydrase and lipid transport n=1 Tax=Jiangella ureilytica TaxID=2530374 RepID=A0A4V2XX33_9ACTN|nr:polyketide cyclase / dehydrase and lipid transport [Jiangella ureilytica]TDC51265.1 polyketide cyclase / dehydrase and lipid transport [Jiangella ureilytica]